MPHELVNGVKLHYSDSGEGIPLVFIHPPLLTSANFQYQRVQLADEFRVITFDIRGHGLSEESESPISYALIAEDIKQLLDRLGVEKAFVCGYSTGGTVALKALLDHSDRFLGGILISAMSEASDPYLRGRIRLAIGLSRWKTAVRLLMLAITWGNSDSKQTYRNMMKLTEKGSTSNIHQYYRYSLNFNCTKELPRIKHPVLLLYGEKDWGFRRYRKLLMSRLPNASLVVLGQQKHQLPTKAADEMNEAIRQWVHLQGYPTSKSPGSGTNDRIPEPFIIEGEATELHHPEA
ncbi:alpha/beta hydrolase [Paenibacillus nanensis]|uniref:Alpha/beta hydrolase n=1 Tax=Paenibacillus nanensis TaxID=393251 RepID=A0A3A1VI81_9BACL|nr:alpha/beta hydrolase [Paenibacillus nanensis]RIX60161.1 alpha/beta hydrolase [Paenibacillus nanensis]